MGSREADVVLGHDVYLEVLDIRHLLEYID